MKNKIILMIVLIFTMLLTGCDLASGDKALDMSMVNVSGVGDFKIDVENKEISLSVSNDVSEFNVSEAITILNTKLELEAKELDGSMIGKVVSLEPGNNVFIVTLPTLTFKVNVYRLNPDDLPIEKLKEIKIGKLETNYELNEEFKGGSIILVYEDKEEEIEINPNMLEGFDTSLPGEASFNIVFGHLKLNCRINVASPSKEIYYIEQVDKYMFKAHSKPELSFKVKIHYVDETVKDAIITEDMLTNELDLCSDGDLNRYLEFNYEGYIGTINYYVELVSPVKGEFIDLKDVYYAGDYVSLTAKFTYEDGCTEYVSKIPDGFNSNVYGEQTVSLTKNHFTIEAKLNYQKNKVVDFDWPSYNRSFWLNQEVYGLNITEIYEDGSKGLANVNTNSLKTDEEGSFKIKLTHAGITKEFEYTVGDVFNGYTAIQAKSEYLLNEEMGEAYIVKSYTSGYQENIEVTESMVSGFSTSKFGKFSYTITYLDMVFSLSYEVKEKTVISAKLEYQFIQKTAMALVQYLDVVYSDGTTEYVSFSEDDFIGYVKDKPGLQEVSISYFGVNYSFNILNEASGLKTLRIYDSDRRNYKPGEEMRSLEIEISDYNYNTRYIPVTKNMITGFSTSKPGKYQAIIEYEGYKLIYDYYVMGSTRDKNSIKSIELVDYKREYEQNEAFKSGGKIKIVRYNSNIDYVDLTKDMIIYFDTSVIGSSTGMLVAYYEDRIIEIRLDVKKPVVEVSWAMQVVPSSVEIGQRPEYATIRIHYSDGNIKGIDVPQEILDAIDTSTPGDKQIVYTVNGRTFDGSFRVLERRVVDRKIVQYDAIYLDSETEVGFIEVRDTYNDGDVLRYRVNKGDSRLKTISIYHDFYNFGNAEIEFDGVRYSLSITTVYKEITGIADQKWSFTLNSVPNYLSLDVFHGSYLESLAIVNGAIDVSKIDTSKVGIYTISLSCEGFNFNVTINIYEA